MTPSDLALPTKACHNCRRKRWKCDRSLPVCRKCLSSGSECLGYGQLFVWNQGVASRGKMMGKAYQDSDKSTKEDDQAHSLPARVKKRPENPDDDEETHYHSTALVKREEPPDTTIQPALIDPLLQDLDGHSRYYLHHFATQLCADMVINDSPGQNPMRDLIPTTSNRGLLLQIIIANAAFHVFNISKDWIDAAECQQQQEQGLVAYYQAASRYSGPLKSSYHDALMAKTQALSLLALEITAVDDANVDYILAAILLFVNYDLIESGKDKWRVHMEGARRIIILLATPPYRPHAMSKLRTYLLSEFLVFYILGSTFCFKSTPNLIPDFIPLDLILQYAETNNYLSCPAPLLRIMLKSFDMSDLRETPDEITLEVQEQLGSLIEDALAFDPHDWLRNFQPISPFEDVEKRIHIASAHRAAVCIYLARLIPCTNPLLNPLGGLAVVSLTGLADEIVRHVSELKPSDQLFKSICWPLFLAGAETDDPGTRTWIMDTLDSFYRIMYWGYIRTVKRVLEAIWECKDNSPEGASNCWVNEVKEMGTEILIA